MLQSYLIIGPVQKVSIQTESLAKDFDKKFDNASIDVQIIEPVKKNITIDQIRSLKNTIYQKPISLQFKFVIIHQCHSMTKEAQNALLKILEEPPQSAIIIMETTNKDSLLPTIVSRVGKIFVNQILKGNKEIFDKDLSDEISEVGNPAIWVEDQMFKLTSVLKEQVNRSNWAKAKQIANELGHLEEARKMLESNVNPNFVIASLKMALEG